MSWPESAFDFKVAKDLEKAYAKGKKSNSGCMFILIVFFCIVLIPILSLIAFSNHLSIDRT